MSSIRVDRRAIVVFGLVLAVGSQLLPGGSLALTVMGVLFAGGATAAIVARRREASARVRSVIRAVTVLGAYGALFVWAARSAPLSLTVMVGLLLAWIGLALVRDISPAWNSALPGLALAAGTGVSLVNGTPYALYTGPIAFTFLWYGLQYGKEGRPGLLAFHVPPLVVWVGIAVLGQLEDMLFVTLIALVIVGFMTWVALRDRRRLRAAAADA